MIVYHVTVRPCSGPDELPDLYQGTTAWERAWVYEIRLADSTELVHTGWTIGGGPGYTESMARGWLVANVWPSNPIEDKSPRRFFVEVP